MRKALLVVFYLLLITGLNASTVRKMSESNNGHIYFDGRSYEMFVTNDHDLGIKDILSPKYQALFNSPGEEEPSFNTDFIYWVKFEFENDVELKNNLLLTVYSHQTNEVEFYMEDQKGHYISRTLGSNYDFDSRKYDDHFLIFDLNPEKDVHTYYLKFKSDVPINLAFSIDTSKFFLKEHNAQYNINFFIFGLIFMVISYNLYLYIVSKKHAFMFFVLYALASAVYILDIDGLGFQYFWPHSPEFNKISFEISNGFMMTFALLLSTNMLRLYKQAKTLHYIHVAVIVIKIASLLVITNYLTDMVIDVFMLSLPVVSGFLLYKESQSAGRVYLTASIILLIGYSLFVFRMNHVIVGPEWMYSAFKYTLVIQCVILSKALSERYRRSLLQMNSQRKVVKDPKTEEELQHVRSRYIHYKTQYKKQLETSEDQKSELDALKSDNVYLKVRLQDLELQQQSQEPI